MPQVQVQLGNKKVNPPHPLQLRPNARRLLIPQGDEWVLDVFFVLVPAWQWLQNGPIVPGSVTR